MADLRSTLQQRLAEFVEALDLEARGQLDRADDLSIHERDILSELGPEGNRHAELIRLGAAALQLAQNLNGADWRENYILQDAIDPADPYFGIPRRGLEVAAARQFVDGMAGVTSRAQEIVWLALNTQPSRRVTAYLSRLGRCYVAGFDAEVVILCRSVLDTALRDVVGDGCSGPTSMAGRIECLRERGDLSAECVSAAHQIRIRGNKAVHEEPADSTAALDTVRKTMMVLSELFDGGDAEEWMDGDEDEDLPDRVG